MEVATNVAYTQCCLEIKAFLYLYLPYTRSTLNQKLSNKNHKIRGNVSHPGNWIILAIPHNTSSYIATPWPSLKGLIDKTYMSRTAQKYQLSHHIHTLPPTCLVKWKTGW